jgi:hypothetical protein
MRLNEVDEIFDRIMGLMDDCPEPLKLDADGDNRSIAWVWCPSRGQNVFTYASLQELLGRLGHACVCGYPAALPRPEG